MTPNLPGGTSRRERRLARTVPRDPAARVNGASSTQGRTRPADRLPTWGDPPPRSAAREVVSFLVLLVAFAGSLVLAGTVGADWLAGLR